MTGLRTRLDKILAGQTPDADPSRVSLSRSRGRNCRNNPRSADRGIGSAGRFIARPVERCIRTNTGIDGRRLSDNDRLANARAGARQRKRTQKGSVIVTRPIMKSFSRIVLSSCYLSNTHLATYPVCCSDQKPSLPPPS